MNPKPSKRQRFKNFILRRKLNTLGLLVITLMSGLITIVCAVRGFSHTDILIFVTALLVILCFVQKVKLKRASAPCRTTSNPPSASTAAKTTRKRRRRDFSTKHPVFVDKTDSFQNNAQQKGLSSLTKHFKKQISKHFLDMGLCPIAPPKGFPVALWKPSGTNT